MKVITMMTLVLVLKYNNPATQGLGALSYFKFIQSQFFILAYLKPK